MSDNVTETSSQTSSTDNTIHSDTQVTEYFRADRYLTGTTTLRPGKKPKIKRGPKAPGETIMRVTYDPIRQVVHNISAWSLNREGDLEHFEAPGPGWQIPCTFNPDLKTIAMLRDYTLDPTPTSHRSSKSKRDLGTQYSWRDLIRPVKGSRAVAIPHDWLPASMPPPMTTPQTEPEAVRNHDERSKLVGKLIGRYFRQPGRTTRYEGSSSEGEHGSDDE